MIVVVAPLILGILALAALRVIKVGGGSMTLAGASLIAGGALFLGLAPSQFAPPSVSTRHVPPRSLAQARQAFTGQFTPAENWLRMSDALASRGGTEDAAGILIAAVREHPHDYSLWIGLGNALVDHSGGLTPAARFAFDRAQQHVPGHPAPAFFLGLAEARSGHRREAARLWRAILARAPANASWRPMVEDALLAVGGADQAGS